MADETNPDYTNEKSSFISELNPDAPSFEHSNSLGHIEETQPIKFSTEENNNTDSHIQPVQNGEHQQNSSTIEQVDSNENHSTESESIEEITSNDEQQTSTSHIQSTDTSDQHSFQTNENSSEQSNNSNIQDQSTTNNDDQSSSNNDDQSNNNKDDQFDIPPSEDHSDLLLVPNTTLIPDKNLPTETELRDEPEEIKSQRELDEDEIPPAELPVDQTATNEETNNASSKSETVQIDERALTELETPYEHNQERETSSFETPEDEISKNNETNISETSFENVIPPITLSSFLPDVVTETIEQNQGDFIPQSVQSEKILPNEDHVQSPADFTEADFPPLPLAANPLQMTLNDKDFPPLPTATGALDETSNNQGEKASLSRNNPSILSEPMDVLGNRTLFKQTIVKGESNSHPTRSTMVGISYRLSLVDSLTSSVRLIENVTNERYFVSENDLIPAIDICVQLMDRGEHALIDSDIRHCYGEIGCEDKHIPPVTLLNPYRMKIELELHDWTSPPDVQILSLDQRLYWGSKKREMGNFYYRRQDYQTSLQCYRGALRFLDNDDNPLSSSSDQSQRSILNDRYVQVQNNVAQVNLLLNKYEACLNAVENVLKHDPRNVKALFRQGKALYELGKYDQAIQSLKLFIQIQKGNSSAAPDIDKANEMISVCENKLATYQKSEKEIYRRMFQPTPTTTTTTNSTVNQQRQTKTNNQIGNANNNWWPYIALGSAALATVGLLTFIKYRKVS